MNRAPAMPAANRRPLSTGRIRSCSPWTTSVGAVISARRARDVVSTGGRAAGGDSGEDQAVGSAAPRRPRRSAARDCATSPRRTDRAPTPTAPPRPVAHRDGRGSREPPVPEGRRAPRRPWRSRGRASGRAAGAGSAISWAIAPPNERPTTCACSAPAASSTASASSAVAGAARTSKCASSRAIDRSATPAVSPMPVRNRTGGRVRPRVRASDAPLLIAFAEYHETELTSPQLLC